MKLQLPSVTLICWENADHNAAIGLLHHLCRMIEFGAVRLLNFHQGRLQYRYAVNYEAFKHVLTEHMLSVHLDGYVLHPESWRDEWLSWDYIGAPWRAEHNPMRVGNDGFVLKSRRLMNRVAALPWQDGPADELVCNVYRDQLVSEGFRFAPPEVAAKFAIEETVPESGEKPFGFHGSHFPRWGSVDAAKERATTRPTLERPSSPALAVRTAQFWAQR